MESLKNSTGMCQPVALEKVKPSNWRSPIMSPIIIRTMLRKIRVPSPLKMTVKWSSNRANDNRFETARITEETRPVLADARSAGVRGTIKGDAKSEKYCSAYKTLDGEVQWSGNLPPRDTMVMITVRTSTVRVTGWEMSEKNVGGGGDGGAYWLGKYEFEF